MNLEQIKLAVMGGKIVHWATTSYRVIWDAKGCQWLIWCTLNDWYCGLTWRDGVTLNGKESEFFVGV